jgi:hypothetical protein
MPHCLDAPFVREWGAQSTARRRIAGLCAWRSRCT